MVCKCGKWRNIWSPISPVRDGSFCSPTAPILLHYLYSLIPTLCDFVKFISHSAKTLYVYTGITRSMNVLELAIFEVITVVFMKHNSSAMLRRVDWWSYCHFGGATTSIFKAQCNNSWWRRTAGPWRGQHASTIITTQHGVTLRTGQRHRITPQGWQCAARTVKISYHTKTGNSLLQHIFTMAGSSADLVSCYVSNTAHVGPCGSCHCFTRLL